MGGSVFGHRGVTERPELGAEARMHPEAREFSGGLGLPEPKQLKDSHLRSSSATEGPWKPSP